MRYLLARLGLYLLSLGLNHTIKIPLYIEGKDKPFAEIDILDFLGKHIQNIFP